MAANADFDLKALYEALDAQRQARGLSWAAAAREINRFQTEGHPIAVSTITSLKSKSVGEGNGILRPRHGLSASIVATVHARRGRASEAVNTWQCLSMLYWLRRTPESFISGFEDADAERYRFPELAEEEDLRWDTIALHTALNAERQARGMTWKEVAQELGRCTPGMLMYLANGTRIGFPGVMRLTRWVGQPAVNFIRVRLYPWASSSNPTPEEATSQE